MEIKPPSPPLKKAKGARFRVILKSATIVTLILLLHVPLMLVRGTLSERRAYRDRAVASIAEAWGGNQTVTGPLLAIPVIWTESAESRLVVDGVVHRSGNPIEVEGSLFLLPASLKVDGLVETSIRYRGIFETAVYQSTLSLTGSFNPADPALAESDCRLDWGRARLVFGLSDLRGISEPPGLVMNGVAGTFSPDSGLEKMGLGISAPIGEKMPDGELVFEIELAFRGSGGLSFVPMAAENTVVLSGNWPTPGFRGSSLPAQRKITDAGFSAGWGVSSFGRPFPQSWTDRSEANLSNWHALGRSSFGVDLITPIDAYRTVERSLKYGVLFFVLIFTVFFLFEVVARVRVHPFQYLLVGAALCLFYLGFLSLGEILGQGVAYLLSALACITMITLYTISVLRGGGRSIYVATGLGATYLCLYIVLRLEDFALLAGTVALFAALSLVMFVTRRIDWYGLENSGAAHPEGPRPVSGANRP
ncbi:MAG: cell envelope integrity protein CreD [Opitutaceae bacterium]